MIFVVPVPLLCTWLAWRGSLTGLLLWLGAAFYVIYAYAYTERGAQCRSASSRLLLVARI